MSMRFMIQQSDLLKNRIDSLVGGRGGGAQSSLLVILSVLQ